jgi:glycine betaine/choline ABC-type transport system substrate-binding protein
MSKGKKLVWVGAVILVALIAVVGVAVFRPAPDVVIGGKDFTEQDILAEIMALMIEENSDLTVSRKLYLGGTMVCYPALKSEGGLDIYAEYTGTALVSILDRESMNDPNAVYRIVQREFRDEGLVWLDPFGFDNTFTLTMRGKQARELGLETYSDLAEHVRSGAEPELKAGFTAEFLERPDGYNGLTEAYDFEFAEDPAQLDPGLMYKVCATGEVDVICAFATDGRIEAYDLYTLRDDKQFFPPYEAAPLVKAAALEEHPQIRELLDQLGGRIDDATMRELNYKVDRQDNPLPARRVAREFLISEGLIPGE